MVKVEMPVQPACILTATPDKVVLGKSALLKLTSDGNTDNQFSIQGKKVKELTVFPLKTRQYIGKVSGPGGTVLCKVKVGVN